MALLGWVLILELAAYYGLPFMREPVDSVFMLAWGLTGLVAGWYGMAGHYWQRLAWVAGMGWYLSHLSRFIGILEPVASASPGMSELMGLLYLFALPIAWMVSLMAITTVWFMGDEEE